MLNAFQKAFMFVVLILACNSVHGQTPFKENTFDEYAYPGCVKDEQYTRIIEKRSRQQFPNARTLLVASFLTTDRPRQVVSYYSKLSGQRFFKYGNFFTYVFSEIDGKAATRIDVYPVEIAKTYSYFWPTRIDLYIIRYPIRVKFPQGLDQSKEELKQRVGRLYFDGRLRKDIARLDMEEIGPDAEVYVIETDESFYKVTQFFRHRYGRIEVIQMRDQNMWVRQAEFDASWAIRLEADEIQLVIRIEENPLVIDRHGNTQLYKGKVFIKYIFWKQEE
ncbi:MAG: hypothetical protein U5R06_11315 [candidate division KSB1 bacterium]|nr:hypothetical protein [candidate division KSB1 bacterium]